MDGRNEKREEQVSEELQQESRRLVNRVIINVSHPFAELDGHCFWVFREI